MLSKNNYDNILNTHDDFNEYLGEKSTVLGSPVIKQDVTTDDLEFDFCLKEIFDYIPFNPFRNSDGLGEVCITRDDIN